MSSEILQKQKVFWEKLTGKLFCVRSIMRLKVVGSFREGEGGGGRGKENLKLSYMVGIWICTGMIFWKIWEKGSEKKK